MEEKKAWHGDVPVPVDADGNVVPLTTQVMYDEVGNERLVSGYCSFTYHSGDGQWGVNFVLHGGGLVSSFHLAPPDSLEKLADDLARYDEHKAACEYFGIEVAGGTCDGCRGRGRRLSCIASAFDDVARRVRALREAERDGD